MKCLLILALAVTVTLCSAGAPFELCSGKPTDVKVTGVDVPGCTAAPCVLKRGTNVSITATFTTAKAFSNLSNKLYGEIGGVDVPFPGYPSDQVDACKLGVTCPTTAGGSSSEKITLPVKSSDPAITLVAKWEFLSDKTMVGCVEVPLKLSS